MGAGIQVDNHRIKPSVNLYSLQHIPSQSTTEQHIRLIVSRFLFLLYRIKLLMSSEHIIIFQSN